jgi:hypothetical protein
MILHGVRGTADGGYVISVGPFAAHEGVWIVREFGTTVDFPVPEPLAASPGSAPCGAPNVKETDPTNGFAWALEARAMARPRAERSINDS